MRDPKTPDRDSGTDSDTAHWLQRLVRQHGSLQSITMVLTVVSLIANLLTITVLVRLENRRDSLELRVTDLEHLLSSQTTTRQLPPNKQ